MRHVTAGSALLILGILIGGAFSERSAAQQPNGSGMRLNSVGLSVKNLDQAVTFYSKTLGFREAFTLRDAAGRPTMTFLHISGETFLQLVPANEARPPGLSSVLLEVDDVRAATLKLRQAGAELQDPRVSPNTRSTLTSLRDPEGNRIELLQMTEGSLIGAAMRSGK